MTGDLFLATNTSDVTVPSAASPASNAVANSAFEAGDAKGAFLFYESMIMENEQKHLDEAKKLAQQWDSGDRVIKHLECLIEPDTSSPDEVSFSGLCGRVRAVCDRTSLTVGLYSPSWENFERSYLDLKFSSSGKIDVAMKPGALEFISFSPQTTRARLDIPVLSMCLALGVMPAQLLANAPFLHDVFYKPGKS